MGIKWKGFDKLEARIKTNLNLEAVKQVIKLNGAELQQETIKTAPYKTGQLKRSITLDIKDKGLTAVVAPHVNYASYLEYGTRYMSAQPYLHPAFNKQVIQIKKDLKRLV